VGSLLLGCSPELPDPVVESVLPIWAYNGEVTPIRIQGESFYPSLAIDGGLENGGRIDAQYLVQLVGVDEVGNLTGVTLVDYENLDALVPTGLEAGLYDVLVTAPNGKEARLEQAFTVTNTRADSLRIEIDGVVHQVNDSVAVELSLRDLDGLPVEQDLLVEFVLDSELSAGGVVIEDWGLEDVTELEDAVGVRGRLGLDGRSVVVLTSTLPDELELTLRAADSGSIVREDRADLVFVAGEMEGVQILLPTKDFTATAGENFEVVLRVVDAFGNLVEDQPASVLLFEKCAGFLDEVTVIGSLTVPLSVSKATGAQCPRNWIQAISGLEGNSDSFFVLPGPLSHFDGERMDGELQFVAGDVGTYKVFGRDAFENAVDLDGEELVFEDSIGSLAEASCELGSSVPFRICALVFEQAVVETELQVSAMGVGGVLGNYEVIANSPTQILVGTLGNLIVAGALFEVEVTITDSWGNPVDIDGNQTPITASDGGFGTLSCNWLGSQVQGVHILSCSETTAAEHMQFTVRIDALGIQGLSDIVAVVNGALSSVILTATDLTLIAGELFDLEIEGFDAYGNGYKVQSNPNLSISDSASGITTTQAQLGSSGLVLLSNLSLNKMGQPVILTVSQGGLTLGQLGFHVEHASIDHLEVRPTRTWAWVGEPREILVVAMDPYANPVLDFQEGVQLTSSTGAFLNTTASGFDQGVLSIAVTWDNAGLGDQVSVVAPSASGLSDPLDAVLSDCSSPPSADLEFTASGNDELVTCLNSSSTSLGMDFSGSSAGANSIAFYHLYDGQGSNLRGTSTVPSLWVNEVGVFVPDLMVVDTAACGHLVDGLLWAGENDGSVTGPVSISSSATALTAGSSTQGTATISVSAEDCAGDVASNELLFTRVDLGQLDPAGAALSPTGVGLALTLGSSGTGSFAFDVSAESFAGEATVAVGNLNGSAYGEVSISVEGDNAQPKVAWMDPSGLTSEQLDQVLVQFTEAMESSTLSSSNVSLVDGNGDAIGFSLSLSTDSTLLWVDLDSTLDAANEEVTLSLTSDIRDISGNFLDGDWSGTQTGTDFAGFFGDVVDDGLTVQGCALQEPLFIPDGDSSTAFGQADEAGVSLNSSIRGEMWLLEVFDSTGTRIRTYREATVTTNATLLWDGRGDDGILSEPGDYLVGATVEDAQGNVSAGCLEHVMLLQAYQNPERLP
jgi:hypothetical protein